MDSRFQIQGLKRFPPNPEANWGPKPRAKRFNGDADSADATDKTEKPNKKERKNDKNPSSKPDLKQFSCKRFLAGKCERDADSCVYSHNVGDGKNLVNTREKVEDNNANSMDVSS